MTADQRSVADDQTSFIDTNILVYAHDRSETRKQPIAQALLDDLWRQRTGTLSTQVLQEFYVVATRKFEPPMRRPAAREIVALYSQWPTVQVDVALILAASKLEERHTLSGPAGRPPGRRRQDQQPVRVTAPVGAARAVDIHPDEFLGPRTVQRSIQATPARGHAA